MVTWILIALGVYLMSVYVPAALYLPREGLMRHLGARDDLPEAGALTARARRAHANLMENMPLFLTPAILTLVVPNPDMALAILGAKIFVFARLAYIPAYLWGIPGIRSLCYVVGLAGCGIIALALL